jgi:mono/diheme cytochrome c family protein
MWSAMAARGITRPKLTTEQAADLFAYFYAARYSAQPGDAGRGRRVFESKECAGCHGVSAAKAGAAKASPVADWRSLSDPILLAQQMWNHSGQMSAALSGKKIEWPRLSSRELTDLLVYLQSLPETRGRQAQFAPASAETGKMLVQLKGCTKCHTGRLSLDNRFTNRTVADFAAAMWNHAPKMADPAPELRPEEMRRIVGYLWSLQVFDDRGSPDGGRKVFTENQCASCHGDGSSGAPKLTGSPGVSAFSMVAAPWRRGPAVLQDMKKKGISWPKFEGSDMADLLAYLKTRQ